MSVKDFLNDDFVKRVRIPEDRNFISGLRCNRNERVSNWDNEFVEELLNDINVYDFTLYPDLNNLYEELANYEKIEKSKILIGSGIDGIIKNIFETFTSPGMKIGVLNPTYAMYYVYSNLYKTDLELIGYNIENFKLDKEKLFQSLSSIKVLFIPNPNQPVEDNFNLEAMREISIECKKRDILLVFDEAYYGFGCDSAKSLIEEFENIIVMRTFSKAFGMPSIRVGYMMANTELTARISQKRLSYETNSICQKIAINLIRNSDYIQKYNKKVCEARDIIKNQLSELKYDVNAFQSNFILIKFKSESERDNLNKNLLEKSIYTKANYKGDMSSCMLVTLGIYSDMIPLLNELKLLR